MTGPARDSDKLFCYVSLSKTISADIDDANFVAMGEGFRRAQVTPCREGTAQDDCVSHLGNLPVSKTTYLQGTVEF